MEGTTINCLNQGIEEKIKLMNQNNVKAREYQQHKY